MPVIRTTLIEGYDDETKRRLGERLTDAVCATIAAPLDGITVILEEVKPSGYMRGRQARVPGAPTPSGADLVRDYLAAMEARDLERAAAFLAEGFSMVFPGGHRFRTLPELVEWGRTRYRFVRKTYQAFDEAFSADGMIVYCFGTLAGEWPDGTPFDGIRFIDRFTVAAGKLTDQKVWNDLAEARTAGQARG
ncbi:MAG: tautomerase family protein [Zhengella sp.]|uniref:tautomerase family protein n=1 Tax=Zhengella sp. TaxID=2282762 RepID=UPI001DD7948C|nr:tautomerase family protein [Notoacmeibacter sp.]MCC0028684.1 tautomerase family protein [Brucellaceae bacterium]